MIEDVSCAVDQSNVLITLLIIPRQSDRVSHMVGPGQVKFFEDHI